MRRSTISTLTLAVLTAACQGDSSFAPPGGPLLAISDGTREAGNPDFFFVPPMVPNPNGHPDFGDGDFNPDLAPVVEICALSGGACAGDPVAVFSGDDVSVSRGNTGYHVGWDTDATDLATDYRITVTVSGVVMGYADVDIVANGGQAKRVDGTQFVAVVQGRTLPISFRIERGAFCDVDADCGEATISNAGGTLVTNTGLGGASFPSGWLPETEDEVLVIIERFVPEKGFPCLPTQLVQFAGCYTYTTIPELAEFSQPVVIGVCIEIDHGHPFADLVQLHKFEPEDPRPVIEALENVEAPFVVCEEEQAAGTSGGRLGQMARAGLGALRTLLLPTDAHAAAVVHRGLGGLAGSFSRVGWAVPMELQLVAGDGQSATVGSPVPIDPTVRLISTHPEIAPVAFHRVHFKTRDASGNVVIVEAVTDADGVASTEWVLTQLGTNTMEVWSNVLAPLVLTATGN